MPEQNATVVAISTLAVAFLLANVVAWWRIIARWSAGEPAIPFEARRPVPWGLAGAAAILGVWFVLIATLPYLCLRLIAGDEIASAVPEIDRYRASMLGTLWANLSSISIGGAWLAVRGARIGDFGFIRGATWRDMRLGALAFVAAVVPVYAIQFVLVSFWPSEHPLISLLKKSPDGWIFALAVLSAALVAPIVEEFLFRLVLQGALETAEIRTLSEMDRSKQVEGHAFVGQLEPATSEFSENAPSADVEPGDGADASGEFANPYRAPAGGGDALRVGSAMADSRTLVRSLSNSKVWGLPMGIWPMTISATVFALLHAGHGPDPIPLLLFALMLGYLYRQTHRMLPSIVLHMSLNTCSLILLWLQLTGRLPE